jgi:hypothetical protein
MHGRMRRYMDGQEPDMMSSRSQMSRRNNSIMGGNGFQPPMSVRSMHSLPMDENRRFMMQDPPERVIRLRPKTITAQYDPYADAFFGGPAPFARPPPRALPPPPPPMMLGGPMPPMLLPPPRMLSARPLYSSMDMY